MLPKWPLHKKPKKFATDLTVPQHTKGDLYWVCITMPHWSVITQWRGTPKQIEQNCNSWYRRDALAVELELII